jgi:hypothetical protein
MSLGSVFGATSPTLNSPFDWYTQLKLRQQGAQHSFRLPVLQNFANEEKNLLRLVERNANPLKNDQRDLLKLATKDAGEHFRQFVNKPVHFNEALIERVKRAGAVDEDDDKASVVSDTLSVDEIGDPAEYTEAKAKVKERVDEVKATQKAGNAIAKSVEALEKKAATGKLTDKEEAKLQRMKEHLLTLTSYAHKGVPQMKADLKALKKSAVRELLRGHLQKTSGAPVGDADEQDKEAMAKLLQGSSLKLTTGGDLWWHGAKVRVDKLNAMEAERIRKVLLKAQDDNPDVHAPNLLAEHIAAVEKRLANLAKKKSGAGAGASSAAAEAASSPPSPSAAAASAAPSRSVSRAVSPAPPETEAEDEEGGGDGMPQTIKIKRAASGSAAAAEKKGVKIDDNLLLKKDPKDGRRYVIELDKVEVVTLEQYKQVLQRLANDHSEAADKIRKHATEKIKKLEIGGGHVEY